MNFNIMTMTLTFLLLSKMTTSHTIFKDADEAAAECLSMGRTCSTNQTTLAQACVPNLPINRQPTHCVRIACSHCLEEGNSFFPACRSWKINVWCPVLQGTGMGGAAAKCLHLRNSCGGWIKYRSKHCGSNIPTSSQPLLCKRAACAHCKSITANISTRAPIPIECTGWSTVKICEKVKVGLASPEPTRRRSHSHAYARTCVYTSQHGHLVIPMSDTRPRGRWARTKDGSKGLTWRSRDTRLWTSSAGAGEMCYRTKFEKYGTYFLTAMTAGASKRDHNDMFIRFSGGLNFLNARTNRKFPFRIRARNSYFKAYQNIGDNRRTKVLSTVNGNPHILVSHALNTTKEYTLCFGGRSSMFSVYSLIMIKCHGYNCMRTSNYMRKSLRNNTASPCVAI